MINDKFIEVFELSKNFKKRIIRKITKIFLKLTKV